MKFVSLIKFLGKMVEFWGIAALRDVKKVFSSHALLAFSISEILNFEMEI